MQLKWLFYSSGTDSVKQMLLLFTFYHRLTEQHESLQHRQDARPSPHTLTCKCRSQRKDQEKCVKSHEQHIHWKPHESHCCCLKSKVQSLLLCHEMNSNSGRNPTTQTLTPSVDFCNYTCTVQCNPTHLPLQRS